jgi:acetate kinase
MLVRKMVISHLQILNFHLDDEKNKQARFGQSGNIAANNSRSCWVIPTNEEFVIAEQTHQLLSLNNTGE